MRGGLELQRPLVAFDLETTGLDVRRDRIVDIACVKLEPDGGRVTRTRRLNPEQPISVEAMQVHGIRDEDVVDAPTFRQVARSLLDFLDGCDLTGFNLRHFDLPMLEQEFARAGITFPDRDVRIVDSRTLFMIKEPRDLTAACRFYCDRELTDAHSAEADAVAAADVLLAQVAHYDDLPVTIDDLHQLCDPRQPHWIDPQGKLIWHNGEACLGFGRHKRRPLREMLQSEPEYLVWITQAEFSPEVQTIVGEALAGRFPAPQEENSPSAGSLSA